MCGGEISVASKVGKESRFIVTPPEDLRRQRWVKPTGGQRL